MPDPIRLNLFGPDSPVARNMGMPAPTSGLNIGLSSTDRDTAGLPVNRVNNGILNDYHQRAQDLSDHPTLGFMQDSSGKRWTGTYEAARAMQQAYDAAQKDGVPVQITSAFRDRAKQAELYANRASNPYPVAPPGSSNHEQGISFDVTGNLSAFDKYAARFGFVRPFPDKDEVHYTYQPQAPLGSSERVWGTDHPGLVTAQSKQYKPGSPQAIAQQMGASYGLSPQDTAIAMRMFEQESGFNSKAVSPAGAMGICQMMPGTLAPYMNKYKFTAKDFWSNPSLQIRLGYEYLLDQLHGNGGSWARALKSYNAGPNADPKVACNYPETQNYVAHILGVSPAEAKYMIAEGQGPQANHDMGYQNMMQAQLTQQSNGLLNAVMGAPKTMADIIKDRVLSRISERISAR